LRFTGGRERRERDGERERGGNATRSQANENFMFNPERYKIIIIIIIIIIIKEASSHGGRRGNQMFMRRVQ